MKTTTIAILKKVSTLPSGTNVAEMSLLCGKDRNGKTRYLNGSFIVSSKTKGFAAVEKALASNESDDDILVNVQIHELHCEPTQGDKVIFTSYRGLIDKIDVYVKKTATA